MNAEELIAAGIPLSGNDAMELLRAEAALDWMAESTTLQFDKADAKSLEALPACAKLFVVKFGETMRLRSGVTSQSIEGMSQSFDSGSSTDDLIMSLAKSLLGKYLKSQVTVFQAKRRW
jgi:hypothetical protein